MAQALLNCGQAQQAANQAAGVVVAADATPVVFDLSQGALQLLTLLGSRTLSVINDTDPSDGAGDAAPAVNRFTIILFTGAGSFVPVWWSGIRWAGGAPTVTATANKYDVFEFIRVGTGVYLGRTLAQAL